MPSKLVAVTGPLAGSTFPLGADALAVGRDSANDIHLRDPTVSRHHCRIEPEGQGFRVRDLESRHGTFVNGLPVRERDLDPGDRLSVGNTLFLFLLGGDPAEASSEREIVLWDDGAYAAGTTFHAPPSDFLDPGRHTEADERTTRNLQALLRIGNALHALRSTEELARRLLELILETLPAERATLLVLDRGGEPVTSFALDRTGQTEPFPVSRTLIRKILAERSAVLANDVRQTSVLGQAESVRVTHIQSLLAAPLSVWEGLLGALYVDTLTPQTGFEEHHLELFTAVAGIASLALANVQRLEWLEEERRRLDAVLDHDLIGESPRMREIGRLIARIAPTDATVLIGGESGTGKELVARALHRGSHRTDRPFVAINCATLSETLLESELFGHEKGAFTGALSRKIGKFEVADRGTLFLDEIGEIPTALQAKLLRALQEREFERLGGTRPIRVDVRVIAATNRDLDKALKEGTFREDLYYRLNVISLTLPPLRERREDVPLLASHFAALVGRKLGRPVLGFTPEARACLLRYPWPGNVRELANAVERAVVLGEGELIQPEDLPETVLETVTAAGRVPVTRYHDTLNAAKKRLILSAIEQAGGNVKKAAELLGLHPNYLHRLISNLGLRDRIES
ncbi:MAG TPA: sigma 54-interacting transcriptional regulator [Thermoanaerobaculia bacterium]|nr:sigma 54-interacting transcriptional regulator [Thermoanaerobaculia bacterium]